MANPIGLSTVWPLVLATIPAAGLDSADPPQSTLRFEVKGGHKGFEQPVSGRLLVVLDRQGGEPRSRLGQTGMNGPIVLGRDVAELGGGDTAVLDGTSALAPLDNLDGLAPGRYAAQAVLHTNRDLNFPNAPGDRFGSVVQVDLNPKRGGTVSLSLDQRIPEEKTPEDTEWVKYIKIPSKRLTAFHGRPIFLRASVILPRDFERESDRRYPLRVHIGGYGARHTGTERMMAPESGFRRAWLADDAPRMILLHLDGAGPLGDPYQVNSANHGPYGDAITQELIPHVEQRYRGDGRRVLDGGSTGGWVALALQVFYPDFFAGAWAFCPDGVDFQSFQLVNIYQDENAYTNVHGFERPAARDASGEVRYTMRHECQVENVLGLGDSWVLSGGQWGAWNATYGPRAANGRPVPAWDPKTGRIDPAVRDHWKKYDLRLVLEQNWPSLATRLRGKIHIWVGEADDFFLNNAVHRLDEALSALTPSAEAKITYGPGKRHCWMGVSESEMMTQMAAAIAGRKE